MVAHIFMYTKLICCMETLCGNYQVFTVFAIYVVSLVVGVCTVRVSITYVYTQEGNISDLFRDEGSRALLSSGEEEGGDTEGGHSRENIEGEEKGDAEGGHSRENVGGEEEGGDTEGGHSKENIGGEAEGGDTEGGHSRKNIAGEDMMNKEEIKGGISLEEMESGGGGRGSVENDREKEDRDPDIHRYIHTVND